jgi:hypothetical protein
MTALAERVAAAALEVQCRGVHEHHGELAEQVAPAGKQLLLDQVLDTARGERAGGLLRLRPAYDVAKLVGKTLVRRIERSRRYAVDPPGVRTLCASLLLREKVIKPVLAGVVRPCRRPPKVSAPLDVSSSPAPGASSPAEAAAKSARPGGAVYRLGVSSSQRRIFRSA